MQPRTRHGHCKTWGLRLQIDEVGVGERISPEKLAIFTGRVHFVYNLIFSKSGKVQTHKNTLLKIMGVLENKNLLSSLKKNSVVSLPV